MSVLCRRAKTAGHWKDIAAILASLPPQRWLDTRQRRGYEIAGSNIGDDRGVRTVDAGQSGGCRTKVQLLDAGASGLKQKERRDQISPYSADPGVCKRKQ